METMLIVSPWNWLVEGIDSELVKCGSTFTQKSLYLRLRETAWRKLLILIRLDAAPQFHWPKPRIFLRNGVTVPEGPSRRHLGNIMPIFQGPAGRLFLEEEGNWRLAFGLHHSKNAIAGCSDVIHGS
jgi:hypothetical protein